MEYKNVNIKVSSDGEIIFKFKDFYIDRFLDTEECLVRNIQNNTYLTLDGWSKEPYVYLFSSIIKALEEIEKHPISKIEIKKELTRFELMDI